MLKIISNFVFGCSAFVLTLNAQANIPQSVSAYARKAQYEMLTHFAHGQFVNDTQIALNNAVRLGVLTLDEQGYGAAAKEIWKEWRAQYSHITLRSTEKVGDHEPLYAWLNTYYKFLQAKLGRARCQRMHLNDIPIMNFVIPVAIQPGGDIRNGDHWPKPEYRRHFVPFASISSYWITYGACRSHTPAVYKNVCDRVAMVFKNGVRYHVAPPLSDYIYENWGHSANTRAPLDFNALDRYFAVELAKIPSAP